MISLPPLKGQISFILIFLTIFTTDIDDIDSYSLTLSLPLLQLQTPLCQRHLLSLHAHQHMAPLKWIATYLTNFRRKKKTKSPTDVVFFLGGCFLGVPKVKKMWGFFSPIKSKNGWKKWCIFLGYFLAPLPIDMTSDLSDLTNSHPFHAVPKMPHTQCRCEKASGWRLAIPRVLPWKTIRFVRCHQSRPSWVYTLEIQRLDTSNWCLV